MSRRSLRTRLIAFTGVVTLAISLAACSSDSAKLLFRSSMPTTGMQVNLQYYNSSNPNKNVITLNGINDVSPMELVNTSYSGTDVSTLQSAKVTTATGQPANALGMDKWNTNIGLSKYLVAQSGTYEQRDQFGHRLCGAKVRLTWQPNMFEVIAKDKYRRQWESTIFYSVPCSAQVQTGSPSKSTTPDGKTNPTQPATTPTTAANPLAKLDLTRAKMIYMIINQQMTPRITGKPILFNRGNSVAVVGGPLANYVGGWWERPGSITLAADIIVKMVRDLDSKANSWQQFSGTDPVTGMSPYGGLIYTAGDADTWASWKRLLLNQQSDYLVNFRSDPSKPWRQIDINPAYNNIFNRASQNWKTLTGTDAPNIDSMFDAKTGLPKDKDDLSDPNTDNSKALRQWETAGCQNCPNASLAQVRYLDVNTHKPLWAITIRGYLGSESSLIMFGGLPKVDENGLLGQASTNMKQQGYDTSCPIRYKADDDGKQVEEDQQYDATDCANALREGSLYNLITADPTKYGFDLVGQFRVRDNSTYTSHCTGSGDTTSCTIVPVSRNLEGNYLYSDMGAKLQRSWALSQLMGIGLITFGFSYASGQYDGSGQMFAMAQVNEYNAYYSDLTDPNNVFANPAAPMNLDARADLSPGTLKQDEQIMFELAG